MNFFVFSGQTIYNDAQISAKKRGVMKKIILLSLGCIFFLVGFSSPPPADTVFPVTTHVLNPNTVALQWHIQPGFFLYAKRIHLQPIAGSDNYFRLGTITLPSPIKKLDRQGKSHAVYQNQLAIPVSILGEHPGEGLIQLRYQGCAEDGFCYPPQIKLIKITINQELAVSMATIETATKPQQPLVNSGQTNDISRLLLTNNWLLIIAGFFGFGLLLAFTPCVLPMVPVISGIIVGHGKDINTRKAFLLSLSYVLSMSATYALIGAVVALMGNNLQIIMQSSWAIGFFSLIFVLLALSMFGFYELQLPHTIQSRLSSYTRTRIGGHYLSAAIMGCLSTLILSPCVTAPLIGALGYIAQTGNILLGTIALFFLGLGMGMPLLLIGASAGKLLPRAGSWMNAVKAFFGVLLLAVAVYLLQRLLPAFLSMALWASLFIISSVYLGALRTVDTTIAKFFQGVGLLLLIYGALILIGASQGHTDPLLPLAQEENQLLAKAPQEQSITTPKALENAIATAQGKPIFIDFYADWCTSCKIVAKTTLRDQRIRDMLQQFVMLRVDVTANDPQSQALLQQMHVIAPPTFLFIDEQGKELTDLRLVGDINADTLLQHLQQTLKAS